MTGVKQSQLLVLRLSLEFDKNSKINRTREHPRIVHTEILKCLELISQQQLGLPLYASHQRPGVKAQQAGEDRFGGQGQPVGGGGIERE